MKLFDCSEVYLLQPVSFPPDNLLFLRCHVGNQEAEFPDVFPIHAFLYHLEYMYMDIFCKLNVVLPEDCDYSVPLLLFVRSIDQLIFLQISYPLFLSSEPTLYVCLTFHVRLDNGLITLQCNSKFLRKRFSCL